jgi:hypothetical protein
MKTTLNSHLNPMSRARKIAPFNRIPWSEPQRRGRGQCPDPRSAPRGCRIPVARCQGFEHGLSEQLRWWKEHKSRLKSEKKYVTILMHFGNSNCIYIYINMCVYVCMYWVYKENGTILPWTIPRAFKTCSSKLNFFGLRFSQLWGLCKFWDRRCGIRREGLRRLMDLDWSKNSCFCLPFLY